MLRPRCACSNLAAHASTSLRLLQPRCACADLAAHLTDLAAAAHAPSLAAHAPKPRCACFDTQPRCACSACYYSVHEAEKIDFCQQYVYFQVFIYANKIIMLFFGRSPLKSTFFFFGFLTVEKKIRP